MVPSPARNFQISAVDGKRLVLVPPSLTTRWRHQISQVIILAVVRIWATAALEDASLAAATARLIASARRVQHVPDVVNVVDLRCPQMRAASNIGVCPDRSRLSVGEPVQGRGTGDLDVCVGGVR